MPAIWPPVSPRWLVIAATPPVLDGVDVALIVIIAVMVTGCNEVDAMTGSDTSVHRAVVFEKTQQESVAFGELAAQ